MLPYLGIRSAAIAGHCVMYQWEGIYANRGSKGNQST